MLNIAESIILIAFLFLFVIGLLYAFDKIHNYILWSD